MRRAAYLEREVENMGYLAKRAQEDAGKWRAQESALAAEAKQAKERSTIVDATPFDPERITP